MENTAKRTFHIVARGGDLQKSSSVQSSGTSQEDLRSRLPSIAASDDVLFEPEPEWPIPNLSDRLGDEGEMPVELIDNEAPLFLDEPADLPKPEPRDDSHLDGLFADEHEVTAGGAGTAAIPAGWRAADAAPNPTPGRPRTAVLVAVILAGSVAGFALAYALLT